MKFLCDQMLKDLARWLRAAGYDAGVEPDGTPDQLLLERATAQGRILLTRDRRFAQGLPGQAGLHLLDCVDPDDCFQELREKLGVDWLYRPFTRCLACNTPLIEGAESQWEQVPEYSRQRASRLLYCPNCRQLFWDGSHVRRMRERLQQAAAGGAG